MSPVVHKFEGGEGVGAKYCRVCGRTKFSAGHPGGRKPAGRSPRPHSREFTARGDTGRAYLLKGVPAGLWNDVTRKAKREGLSIRAYVLGVLEREARA